MSSQVTLGGERLGGGKKNKVSMHGYERSTHDLSHVWRSSMASGTLVPFLKQVALPGDTFDIDLFMDVQTQPTIGALFGTYKLHADIFLVPMRLYNAALHMNMLNIGLDMSKIFIPVVELTGNTPVANIPIDNQQVNSSCIFKYLGISGMGRTAAQSGQAVRQFNAIPWLAYWDIYKNYYANKQEGIGAVVHQSPTPVTPTLVSAQLYNASPAGISIPVGATPFAAQQYIVSEGTYLRITCTGLTANIQRNQILLRQTSTTSIPASKAFLNMTIDVGAQTILLEVCKWQQLGGILDIGKITVDPSAGVIETSPKVTTFNLTDIDTMRLNILQAPIATAFKVDAANVLNPYKLALESYQVAAGPPIIKNFAIQYAQEGLGLRTYSSDLFNNWINTSFIDGANGITAVTSVNVVGNKFTIDELNLSKKIYEMLNRIAISGGSYDDWLDSVYTHERQRTAENPMYMGGAIRNIVFQEVVGTAATEGEPLGSLAGRGRLGDYNKGGKVVIKVDEPSYIMGIVSIVPNIDYSQGNDWDGNLKTLNDLHKPALDEIGFQNLITDQMAWFDSQVTSATAVTYKSAGKQPAWINYMTETNKVRGNFADVSNMMFMVLNRRYDVNIVAGVTSISDLTTYIDPSKFNHIFADTRIDAQNFMVQIAIGIEARRKMSAKVIPNL